MNNGIYGALNINKPRGITSHDAVEQVRKLLKTKKVGHTGTLDPNASGVLPICIGKATRMSQYLLEADKEYRLIAKLGETTDTQDAGGQVLATKDWRGVTEADILQIIQRFIGQIEQIPPMYSACKHNGKRLYQLARQGQWVERKPRRVVIYSLKLISLDLPLVTMEVSCSKGTYMRTLCADIGELLGCGAHLQELVRTRCGQFTIEQSISLVELRHIIKADRLAEKLYALDKMLAHLPAVIIDKESTRRVGLGSAVPVSGVLDISTENIVQDAKVRLYSPAGKLLAIGESRLDFAKTHLSESHTMAGHEAASHKIAFSPKKVLI